MFTALHRLEITRQYPLSLNCQYPWVMQIGRGTFILFLILKSNPFGLRARIILSLHSLLSCGFSGCWVTWSTTADPGRLMSLRGRGREDKVRFVFTTLSPFLLANSLGSMVGQSFWSHCQERCCYCCYFFFNEAKMPNQALTTGTHWWSEGKRGRGVIGERILAIFLSTMTAGNAFQQ